LQDIACAKNFPSQQHQHFPHIKEFGDTQQNTHCYFNNTVFVT